MELGPERISREGSIIIIVIGEGGPVSRGCMIII